MRYEVTDLRAGEGRGAEGAGCREEGRNAIPAEHDTCQQA